MNQIARCLNEYGAPYNALSQEVRAATAELAALKFEVLQKVGGAVGNIHVHIVINSLRIAEVPLLPYMERPADTRGLQAPLYRRSYGVFQSGSHGNVPQGKPLSD